MICDITRSEATPNGVAALEPPEGWTVESVWWLLLEPQLRAEGRARDTLQEYERFVGRFTAWFDQTCHGGDGDAECLRNLHVLAGNPRRPEVGNLPPLSARTQRVTTDTKGKLGNPRWLVRGICGAEIRRIVYDRINHPVVAGQVYTEGATDGIPTPPGRDGRAGVGRPASALSPAGRSGSASSLGVDRWTLEQWRRELLAQDMTARNVNKHVGAVRAVLRAAAGYGLLADPPRLRPLPEGGGRLIAAFRPEQVGALYQAAADADWPPGPIPPADWWRACLVLLVTYGLRPGELIGLRPRGRPLTWGQLTFERPSPAGNGLVNRWGWLWYTPAKQRRAKPAPLVLPLTRAVRRRLRRLGPAAADQPLLPTPHSDAGLYGQWRRLVAAAELGTTPDGSAWQMAHLRKASASWYAAIDPSVVGHITGHAPRGVLARHYVDQSAAVLRAIQRLRLPKGMR